MVERACGRECLTTTIRAAEAALLAGNQKVLPLSADVEVRENGRRTNVQETSWLKVGTVRSRWIIADPVTGNVAERAGVVLKSGQPAYLSTRIKVAPSGRVTDIELSFDDSRIVVSDYVWRLDPGLEQPLNPEQRVDRKTLQAIVQRYFASLSSHIAVADDFDPKCNRFHSGTQVTNVTRNGVEGGGAKTCVTAIEGKLPWGPAVEQRLPIIDEERGLVMGITLLRYPVLPGQPNMYVSEVFKIVNGKILTIDNIGVMMPTIETLGFVH
jgi:hypothetical protein